MNILKTNFKTLSKTVVLLTLLFTFSCSKDDDSTMDEPVPGTTFVDLPEAVLGEYTGELSFQSSTNPFPVENEEGTATITKTGDKLYKITFSDGVSELTGFRFIKSNDDFVSSAEGNSSEGVSISGASLAVGFTENANVWAFSGDK